MERDDEQLLRHSTREMAEFLVIFYRELRAAGLPKRVCEQVTLAQWNQTIAGNQAEAIAKTLLDTITNSIDGADADDD